MRTMRRLLTGLVLTAAVIGVTQAAKTPRGALEANDPTLTQKDVRLCPGKHCPAGRVSPDQLIDGPTPIKPDGPEPPSSAPTVGVDGAAAASAPVGPVFNDEPVTFNHALVGVYLRQMTAASRRSDGSLKLIVGCPDMAAGSDRALADALMTLPLPNAFQGAITGFQRWYVEASRIDLPGVWLEEWTREELSTAWKSYATAWLSEHRAEVEPLRAYVADAVLEAGLRRGADLLVTPATYEAAQPRSNDCITCAPPLTCSCQTYADGDCSGAANSCTVTELPPLTKARNF